MNYGNNIKSIIGLNCGNGTPYDDILETFKKTFSMPEQAEKITKQNIFIVWDGNKNGVHFLLKLRKILKDKDNSLILRNISTMDAYDPLEKAGKCEVVIFSGENYDNIAFVEQQKIQQYTKCFFTEKRRVNSTLAWYLRREDVDLKKN
ncbi:MAG: hypothetical protein OEX08_02490 [Candidatus Nomurabacteria bacterium]|nr:hypothetical protein [Candidatus Nomurabacteria bacterium]